VHGKVAFVTGAASGIGRATAIGFARAGARVGVADVDEDGGRETVGLIECGGGEAVFVELDVTSSDGVEAAVQHTVQRFAGLDFACNCAGIQGPLESTVDYGEQDWRSVIDVNLTGVWLCMKHELRHMLTGGGGAIVNIASNFGLVGSPLMPAYCASKHGVIGLTKAAALDSAPQGVRVNALCVGATQTPMVTKVVDADPLRGSELIEQIVEALPLGRIGQPEEAAAAAVWLCSDGARFITGAALSADGGYVAQ
jgi:NAD(P)-dependent dehydrogenase (short-subunit alcohol dehydrogenase family)